MSGLELTARLKAEPRTCDIPVVAVSASDKKPTERSAKAAGCALFLAKPNDARRLPRILARLL